MNNMAVSLRDSPTLGLEDSFTFLVSDIAALLPLSHITDLLLDCLTLVLTLRHWETGVTHWVGRPHHLTHLASPLPPLTQRHQGRHHRHQLPSAGLHPVLETEALTE